jgi:hypothetical protein
LKLYTALVLLSIKSEKKNRRNHILKSKTMSKMRFLLFVLLFAFAINESFGANVAQKAVKGDGNAAANGASAACDAIEAIIETLEATLPESIKKYVSTLNFVADGVCAAGQAAIEALFAAFAKCVNAQKTAKDQLTCAKAAYAAFVKQYGQNTG